MLVSPIVSNTAQLRTEPSFGTNKRSVYKNGKILYKNTTRFFRDDLDWAQLIKFFKCKYNNVKKVNIFNFACSDGSEPWSLAAALLENLKQEAKKFLPINASDIDADVIFAAVNQPCNATDVDLRLVNEFTKNNFYKYFITVTPWSTKYNMAFRPQKLLQDSVQFKKANIFDEIKTIPDKNNIILARNFWSYLEEEDREKLVKLLSEKLDSSSCVIIGELEKGHNYDKLLNMYGFYETNVANVFQKKSKPSHQSTFQALA